MAFSSSPLCFKFLFNAEIHTSEIAICFVPIDSKMFPASVLLFVPPGLVSMKEFGECCRLLNQHTNADIPSDSIKDLARSIDMDKDGYIDFNEFLEAFRLVDCSKPAKKSSLTLKQSSPCNSIHIFS